MYNIVLIVLLCSLDSNINKLYVHVHIARPFEIKLYVTHVHTVDVQIVMTNQMYWPEEVGQVCVAHMIHQILIALELLEPFLAVLV